MMKLLNIYVDEIIKTALKEDINYIDSASDLLLPDDMVKTAVFVAKADGVLAGIDVALRVFESVDGDIKITRFAKDGDVISSGMKIAEVNGRIVSILKCERVSLNFLQHMSGIATYTRRCSDIIKGTDAKITDTRKTLPGLRPIQKYAVTVGGGFNHRYNLSDCAMLKDNHIDAFGSITNAVAALRERAGHMLNVEVEVRTFAELREALACGVRIIMLDNMNCADMAEAVRITGGKAVLEASGNVTLENLREVADTGVDIISLGALTHSVKAFDISLKIA